MRQFERDRFMQIFFPVAIVSSQLDLLRGINFA